MAAHQALLIIDVQAGMFLLPEGQPHASAELLANIARVAERARAGAVPVVYIRHDGGPGHPLQKGTSGWQIHDAIAPKERDPIVEKHFSDSFRHTNLHEILDSLGVTELFVTGLPSEHCVGATALAARALGYEVTVVTDAHSTFSTPVIPAEQIIECCYRVFDERGVRMKPSSELRF